MASSKKLVRPAFTALSRKLESISHLSRARAVLEWDQLVMMPQADTTAASRGAQIAALAGVIHEKETAPELGVAIAAAEEEAQSWGEKAARDVAAIREARLDYDKEAMVPADLAERVAQGGGGGAYESCLEEYERGMGSERIDALFAEVETALVPLIKSVLASEHQPSGDPLSPRSSPENGNDDDGDATWPALFPLRAQEALNRAVVEAMGFDFCTGRVDVSVHPFTTSFGPNDVRITSRFSEQEWYQGLAGSVHECGHALYESQLRDTALPVDRALSMGVHESQSLFWERHVGLSRALPPLCAAAASSEGGGTATEPQPRGVVDSVKDEALFGAVNRVSRGLIRVEADELTYPMHVILRYRLEREILEGKLSTSELPGAWAQGLKSLLGDDLVVPDDAQGCLQDVHWSSLAVGYFPTYLLGAMMAAQLDHYLRHDEAFRAAHAPSCLSPEEAEEGDVVDALVRRGEFSPLKAWLKEKVHDKGSEPKSMDDLLLEEFGEPLNATYFLEYLTKKYSDIYQLRT
eukprot:CAMPEP_0171822314 /NCGR_PEP_ID=MMETSP0992-20121227/3802_1 /TAXON_ID=483369 /ORGANISM="non described non described, Strain CCMP2098" /LENGTH=521 /DNA_ID=CAMNT_0012436899 /DNA_START=58 /DNA_END=1625 /DNA_ORIENTATION=+